MHCHCATGVEAVTAKVFGRGFLVGEVPEWGLSIGCCCDCTCLDCSACGVRDICILYDVGVFRVSQDVRDVAEESSCWLGVVMDCPVVDHQISFPVVWFGIWKGEETGNVFTNSQK